MGHWLRQARQAGVDRLDAQLLVAHVLQRPRAWVLAHEDHPLENSQRAQLDEALTQRLDDVPLAYLTGWREFDGLALRVNAHVLVPRADTETLVGWIDERLSQSHLLGRTPRVLDLGTGSGAIALAVKRRYPQACVTGVDQSTQALTVAQTNALSLQLAVRWLWGHWFDPVQEHRFDVVASNPPYVAPDDPHLHALRHEPQQALVCGHAGLADLLHIIARAGDHLVAGGWLLLEHGFEQGSAVRQALTAAGFSDVQTRQDLAGRERCSGGMWPADAAP